MTEEQETAIKEYERAHKALLDYGLKSGGIAKGYEMKRGQAYQRLVALGLAPKLRRKYRGGV